MQVEIIKFFFHQNQFERKLKTKIIAINEMMSGIPFINIWNNDIDWFHQKKMKEINLWNEGSSYVVGSRQETKESNENQSKLCWIFNGLSSQKNRIIEYNNKHLRMYETKIY